MELKSFKAFNNDGQIKVISEPSNQENPDALNDGCCTHKEHNLQDFLAKHSGKLRTIRNIILFLLYIAYFSYAMYFRFGDEGSWRLLVCTSLGVLHLSLKLLRRRKRTAESLAWVSGKISFLMKGRRRKFAARIVLYIAMTGFIIVYTAIVVAQHSPENLMSLSGLVAFVLLLFAFSNNKRKINWHTVFWGISLQYLFALFIMKTSAGIASMHWCSDRLEEFIKYSDKGAAYVFGDNLEVHRFAFKTMPSLLLFAAVVSVLIYLEFIGFIVQTIGGLLSFCLNTSAPESINVASNIFLGGTESMMIISTYLKKMKSSELFTVMTAGASSCAGSALVMFISFGVPAEPLLSASVMSAPAALACSKLMFPDVHDGDGNDHDIGDEKETNKKNVNEKIQEQPSLFEKNPTNVIEALTFGIQQGIYLVMQVMATTIVFLGLLEFCNQTMIWFGERVGIHNLTVELPASYVFYPIAYLMGVPAKECLRAGKLFGVRLMAGPGIAYISLGKIIKNGLQFREYVSDVNNTWHRHGNDIFLDNWNITLTDGVLSPRSESIITYALCGFSSFPTLGVALAAMSVFVPDRMKEVTKMVSRVLLAGTIASYMTACIAGLLFENTVL